MRNLAASSKTALHRIPGIPAPRRVLRAMEQMEIERQSHDYQLDIANGRQTSGALAAVAA